MTSRFLQQTLMPGERVVHIGRFHWSHSFLALIYFLFFAGLGMLFQYLIAQTGLAPDTTLIGAIRFYNPEGLLLGNLPFWSMTVVGFFIFIRMMLEKIMTEIVITDKRFLYKRGIVSIRSDKMALREINYCEVRQSLLGNALNFGAVLIYTFTLDDDNILLPPIAAPHQLVTRLDEAKRGTVARTISYNDALPGADFTR